jgi:hypothetical protein
VRARVCVQVRGVRASAWCACKCVVCVQVRGVRACGGVRVSACAWCACACDARGVRVSARGVRVRACAWCACARVRVRM